MQAIAENHSLPGAGRSFPMGCWRVEIEEAARLVPAMLARPDGKMAGLWAGDPRACEAAARAELVRYTRLTRPEPANLCLIGMAPFDRSLLGFFKSADLCPELLATNGTGVVTGACLEGTGRHLWRWSAETIRTIKDSFPARFGKRRIYLFTPGVAVDLARRLLPEQVVPLASWAEAQDLLDKERGRGYLVPFGPLTAFAGDPR